MDAPKCRLCEKRHWGLCESGKFPVVGDVVDGVPVRQKRSNRSNRKSNTIPVFKKETAEKLGVCPHCGKSSSEKPIKFDKKAYQREYMKKRRQK